MNVLPQEILDKIAGYLVRHKRSLPWRMQSEKHKKWRITELHLAYYATISRTWQKAVEIYTFAEINVTSSGIDHFQVIVVGARRNFVKCLTYKIDLPPYPHELRGQCEPEGIRQANSERYTSAIRSLFSVLKTWETTYGVQTALRLVIPRDNNFCRSRAVCAAPRETWSDERSIDETVLCFVRPFHFPTLHNVKELEICGNAVRRLDPSIATDMANVLPDINRIEWYFKDRGYRSTQERLEIRQSFAEGLERISIQPKATATIFFHDDILGGLPKAENVVPAGFSYDPLSSALRRVSQNLTKLQLTACLDPSMFWPSRDNADASTPHWPFLKILDVGFGVVSPTGEWYLNGSRRRTPHYATITALLAALANALGEMPVLEYFAIMIGECFHGVDIGIMYFSPGQVAEMYNDEDVLVEKNDLHIRRIYYKMDPEWQLDHEVREGLKGAGKDKFGGEVVEKFTQRWHWLSRK